MILSSDSDVRKVFFSLILMKDMSRLTMIIDILGDSIVLDRCWLVIRSFLNNSYERICPLQIILIFSKVIRSFTNDSIPIPHRFILSFANDLTILLQVIHSFE